MNFEILRLSLAAAAITAFFCGAASRPRSRELFNDGWRFRLKTELDSMRAERGELPVDWEEVTLPHDWSILKPFDRNAAPGNDGGYLPGGTGVYVKDLTLDYIDPSKQYKLYFEGVYEKSRVLVNGRAAGGHPYGYSSFHVDLTPYLRKGNNRIEVVADNSGQKNCRWYSGSGIYRNVWLEITPRTGIADHGVFVNTPEGDIAHISVELENGSDEWNTLTVSAKVERWDASTAVRLEPHGRKTVELKLNVPGARSWSPATPAMYAADVTVCDKDSVVDSVSLPFGFRTVGWSAADGFVLNGKSMKLYGGCVHHDNGILGAAAFDRAEIRKVELLKNAGFNAVRTSHNIPSERFLSACDSLGLLVIDEAFDGWREAKNDHDYHLLFDKWAEKDLESMIRRDRNHPSVISWSIGNEIIERKSARAVADAARLSALCRSLDPGRPVTQALASWDADWEIYDSLASRHDIVGYNYMIHKAESDHERVPERVIWQTESYPRDAWNSYRMASDHSYVAGDFVWTAIDYIGESGIGRWYYEGDVEGEHFQRPLYPWHAAYCGDIDLTGYRKPISHYRSMLWNRDADEHLFIAVNEPDGYRGKIRTTMWGTWPAFESWNWPGHEGEPIDVEVYSHYPVVRLFLDGKKIGEKAVTEMKAVFTLDYAPGELRAEGVEDGKVKETVSLSTAGEAAALRVVPDRTELAADGQDLSFVVIEMTDADGRRVPTSADEVSVEVSGPGHLIALGNADIKDEDSYYDSRHRLWNGRALAVIRSDRKAGDIMVTVKAGDKISEVCLKSV